MQKSNPILGIVIRLSCIIAAASIVYAQPTGFDGNKVVRIEISNDAELATLQELATMGRDFEIWSEVTRIGENEARVAPAAMPALNASGLCYEITVEDLQKDLDEKFGVGRAGVFFDFLRTYNEHVQFMQGLVAAYPNLAAMENIGQSVFGRPLYALRITGPGADKPGVMFNGAQHGNESAGASVIAYLADYLLSNYATDPDVAALVDGVEWFLIPISNPDGYSANTRRNAHNVDLNRNWDGPGAGEDAYGGPYSFSEPETSALRDLLLAHPNIRLHLDVHGYVRWFIWPWGHRDDLIPEHGTYDAIGQQAHAIILANGGGNYDVGPIRDVAYFVSGGSSNYTYGDLGMWAFAIELADARIPDIYDYSLPVMLLLGNWVGDCNGNGIPDAADIAAGSSDCNLNGTPDECEADCDADGVPDMCEISGGAQDCNRNAIPDDCDIAGGASNDCNLNGVPDECELDCTGNGIPDECDIALEPALDCSGNGIPDECEPDCDLNGIADSCDILAGDLTDCDGNGVPDECELSGRRLNLERTLSQLDSRHGEITALIPDRFDFLEGDVGDGIVDGGQRMYERGNHFRTTGTKYIPYTNGAVTDAHTYLGIGSRYFTAKYPGLFILAATDIETSSLRTFGWLGSRSYAQVNGYAMTVEHNGSMYRAFVRRAFGSASPSVNHVFIVPGTDLGVTHDIVALHPGRDQHQLENTENVDEIIYVLVSREDGLYLDDADLLNVVNAVLDSVVFEELDCNGTGLPDACDIAAGVSQDFNSNGVPDECECLGDLDGDGSVNLADLSALLSHYGLVGGATPQDGDLNGDGDVNLADLAALLSLYGEVCN